jgi:uncharacterized membrane protein
MIASIAFVLLIILAWKLPVKWYVYVLYFSTLGLLYSTTLQGISVIGSDISGEMQVTKWSIEHGWNLAISNANNTSFVIGWLVPVMTLSGLSAELVYKIILPMFLAGVPVVLYIMFSRVLNDRKKALYAVLFFVCVPVMQLEIATIGKSMFAELFMALTFLFLVVDMRLRYKVVGIVGCGLVTVFAHYSLGIILCCYVLGVGLWILIREYKTKIRKAVVYLVCSFIMLGSFVGYYSYAGGGYVMSCIYDISGKLVLVAQKVINEITVTNTDNTTVSTSITIGNAPYLPQQQPVIKAAIGGDFVNVSWIGKVFRVIQYTTQVLVVLGCWFMLVSKRIKNEYKAGVIISFGFLAACVLVPIFSNIINVTRFYHIALMFIAPGLIVGIEWIINTIKKIKHV